MMATDRKEEPWRRIEQIFLQAIEIPQSERGAFLGQACGADQELRREVESLLRRDEITGGGEDSAVIAGIIADTAAGLFGDDRMPDRMAGAVIGNYRIIREIGRGGMGAVYLAVRADLGFEQQVAIKLVKHGIDSDAVLKRFWYERRILAGLEHPYITRLLDGGTSPDGRPYFVMEYVDGKPLDLFSRQAGRSLKQRCVLFRKICEAVAYAHRNAIIHLDLKPANVLVTADGTPKLLDFGIARLLSADCRENTAWGPPADQAMTPDFASPEQIAGDAGTTAMDVFSLGATLRVMLKPENPLAVPRDLRIILGKATRAEPDHRYASVADLSEDVRRYLEGLPIQARDQTSPYLAMRFIQRHRAGSAAALLFLFLILGGMIAIVRASRNADGQRQAAELRLGQALEMANHTLTDLNSAMAQLPGTTAARRQMARSTEEYLDQLARDSGNDPRVLAALATAYVRVGEVQGNPDFTNLGDSSGALETYRKALHVLDPLLDEDPENRKLLEISEEAHLGIAYLEGSRGSNEKAEVEARAAIEISRRLLAANPRDPGARLGFLTAHSVRLKHYPSGREGADDEAKRYLPEAIQLARENPQDASVQSNLATYYNLLGGIAGRREALEESLTYYRKCIALREEAARLQPRNPTVLRELAVSYGQAGDFLGSPIYVNLGDFQGALQYFRREAKIVEDLSRSDPSDQRARYDIGMAWMRIGVTLQAKGDVAASNRALARSMTEFGSMQGGVPDQSPYQRALELVYEYEGRNSSMLGDRRGAMEWYGKSLTLAGEQLRKDPRDMPAKRQSVESGGRLAVLLALRGDVAGAQQLIERVLKAAEGTPAGWQGLAWKFQPKNGSYVLA